MQCYKGFYLHSYEKTCKRVNPLCKTSNPTNGACMSCYAGYTLNQGNGACEIFFKDPNCKKFRSDNTCQKCAIRHYINNSGKCSSVSPLCKGYDEYNGFCTSCYPGYITHDGTCILGNSKDPNCKRFQGSTCADCYNGFYLNYEKKCMQGNPICKTFNRQNGHCTSCYPGYVISGSTCVEGQAKDPNCKIFSKENDVYCTECYRGFLAIFGSCKEQNPLCKTVDKSNGNCTTCWPGFSLLQGNCTVETQTSPSGENGVVDIYCVKVLNGVCNECSNGYYYHKQDRICKQVDPLCKDHNEDNGFCTDCYQGFSLSDGRCSISVPVSIPNCVSTSLAGHCTQCLENYYL